MIPVSPDDSQAGGTTSLASLGLNGGLSELAPGRPAAEAAPPSVSCGPVPGGVAPGTPGPLPATPSKGSGPDSSPASGARFGHAPEAGSTGRQWGLEFPPGLPLLSLNGREHWAARNRKARALKDAAVVMCRKARVPRLERISLAVYYDPPIQRRRDHDNLMASYKPLADGIVQAGVVPDDDITHVLPPHCEVTDVIVPKGRLRVYIIEVPSAGTA